MPHNGWNPHSPDFSCSAKKKLRRERGGKITGITRWGLLGLTAVLTAVIFTVQPQATDNFKNWPIGYTLLLLVVAGLAGVPVGLRRENQLNAFFAPCVYLLGMITSVVLGVYPMVLPTRDPSLLSRCRTPRPQTAG